MGDGYLIAAYDGFRRGFKKAPPPPAWHELEDWMRDALRVAFYQGKLDAPKRSPQATL